MARVEQLGRLIVLGGFGSDASRAMDLACPESRPHAQSISLPVRIDGPNPGMRTAMAFQILRTGAASPPGLEALCGCPDSTARAGDLVFCYAKPVWGSSCAGYAHIGGDEENCGHVGDFVGDFQATRT